MADDASTALGAHELAGTFVNPKGMTKKATAAVTGQVAGGMAGTLAANMATGGAYSGAPEVPNFGRVGYLAVTDGELALVKTKTGAFKMKIGDEVLARVPRSEIASTDLDEGRMLSHLKIEFSNGVAWEFDIPKQAKKSTQELVRALGGTFS
jgi:hypothetical protein